MYVLFLFKSCYFLISPIFLETKIGCFLRNKNTNFQWRFSGSYYHDEGNFAAQPLFQILECICLFLIFRLRNTWRSIVNKIEIPLFSLYRRKKHQNTQNFGIILVLKKCKNKCTARQLIDFFIFLLYNIKIFV